MIEGVEETKLRQNSHCMTANGVLRLLPNDRENKKVVHLTLFRSRKRDSAPHSIETLFIGAAALLGQLNASFPT